MENLPDILTMDEAARWLRFSKAHLSHVVNGKVRGLPPLPCIQIGRRKLIRRESLLKWVERAEAPEVTSPRQGSSPQAQRERSN
jgi:hypothetical protein